jgi:hypothetical protein
MAGIPQNVNGEDFPSKKELRARCSKILNSYPGVPGSGSGQPTDVTDPEHIAFLTALLPRHHQAAKKIGSGMASFRVQVNPKGKGNTRCFHVVHPDGTLTHFGYESCI